MSARNARTVVTTNNNDNNTKNNDNELNVESLGCEVGGSVWWRRTGDKEWRRSVSGVV